MDDIEFAKKIARIPGEDGWWHSSNGETFQHLGDTLCRQGFDAQEALIILEAAYSAVADEFGS